MLKYAYNGTERGKKQDKQGLFEGYISEIF